jgi:hypothetical protein
MNGDPRLPVSNPVCTHDWEPVLTRAVWICRHCEYEVSRIELEMPHEGDGDVGVSDAS